MPLAELEFIMQEILRLLPYFIPLIVIEYGLLIFALVQLLSLPFGNTAGQATFRLAVINAKGQQAGLITLFVRWAIVWLSLFVPMLGARYLIKQGQQSAAFTWAVIVLVLWIGAAIYAVIYPNRGLHDRLAGTWVVRR